MENNKDSEKIHCGYICENCKWWASEEEVCCNADSDYCADFTVWNNFCGAYESKK